MSSSKHLRVVERIMQAEAGKAEVHRQRPLDLVAAVVEQLRAGRRPGVGTPSRMTFTVTGRW